MVEERKPVTIALDGSAEFTSLTEAAAAQKDPYVPVQFFMAPGVYHERPFLELDDYRITGSGLGKTILTSDVGGYDPWPGEPKTGTFRTATLFLGGRAARVENMTIENTAGDGAERGQALAVYADAPLICMESVELCGNQDTLFTAPLPMTEREPGGFRGPRENAPRRSSLQYYRYCIIRGNVDFIFGGGNAIFDLCNIIPTPHRSGVCYITAPSTFPDQPGYLFSECTVRGHCPPGSVYLGRPWRANGACYWLRCQFSNEVHPDGWDNWNDPANEKTARFGEWDCYGPGAAEKRAFGTVNNRELAVRQYERLKAVRGFFCI